MKMPSLPALPKSPKMMAPTAKAPKAPKVVVVEPPEDSIGLRVVACSIAILCIVTACLYVHRSQMLIFLYLWGALTGSYVSYQFRRQRTFWLTFITSAGLLIVLGNFLEEIFVQYGAGKIQALVPFIHVLTGLQALHTFDLRAKSDINVSALIGLGLFACTAVLARDMLFAWITLAYITLIASLLYYEAVSRTASAGAVGTSSESAETTELREAAVKKKASTGNVFIPLAMLPVLSIFVFLALPRVESLFDLIMTNFNRAQSGESLSFNWMKSVNGVGVLGTMPGMSGLPASMGGTGGVGAIEGGGASGRTKRSGRRVSAFEPGGTDLVAGGSNGQGGDSVSMPGVGNGSGAPGGNTRNMKPGAKGAKGVKGQKGEKSEKSPAPKRDPEENTSEQEDQAMVFRNKQSAEHDDELLMRVMSSRETYFRRVCFDKYDGHQWTISSLGKVSKCSKHKLAYQELAGVPSLFVEPGMHSAQLTQEISIEANIGHLLPVAAIPQQLGYPKDPIFVDQFGALRTKDPIRSGTHYRVVSQVPDYDLDEMRKAPFDSKNAESIAKEFDNYLQLPADISPEVTKLAKSVAGNDGNWFTKAERICNYLRRNYKYSSDLTDSDNKEEIAYHFLFRTKEGACGPFTTAFVVMCRAIGLPARSIGGFGPGEFNAGTGMHEIKNSHGHAWGEVYIPGYDWVPFDSTPTGLLPKPMAEDNSLIGNIKKGMEQLQDRFANQAPEPPPLPPVTATVPKDNAAGTSDQAGKDGSQKPGDGGKSTTSSGKDGKGATDKPGSSSKTDPPKPAEKLEAAKVPEPPVDWHELILLIIVVPAVVVLIQAIYKAIKHARATKRTKNLEKPKPSTLLYLKVVDDLARVRIHRLPTDTPDELLARFNDDELFMPGVTFHPDLEPLCKHFMELYTADRFGCDDASEMRSGQMKKISEQIHTIVRTKHQNN